MAVEYTFFEDGTINVGWKDEDIVYLRSDPKDQVLAVWPQNNVSLVAIAGFKLKSLKK